MITFKSSQTIGKGLSGEEKEPKKQNMPQNNPPATSRNKTILYPESFCPFIDSKIKIVNRNKSPKKTSVKATQKSVTVKI